MGWGFAGGYMVGGALKWHKDALCAQTDPDLWFPEKGDSPQVAKLICGECPVLETCREEALINAEGHGIWGGLTVKERNMIRKERGLETPWVRRMQAKKQHAMFLLAYGLPVSDVALSLHVDDAQIYHWMGGK